MATKKEAPAEDEEKKNTKPYHDGVDENGLAYKNVVYQGVEYRVRQITVPEADTAWDAAYDEKKDALNWRLYNRFALADSIVYPATTSDDFLTGKWSNAKLLYFLRVHDTLNNLEPADLEGN